MSSGVLPAVFVLWMATAVSSAGASSLQLAIHDGRVWLVAQDVTARQILAEWARVGHTLIVNGERIPGGPLTLQLSGVPEQEALDLLLRSAGGFMAATRAESNPDQSRFDRIVVLPASAAPPDATRGAAATFAPSTAVSPQPPAMVASPPAVQRVIGANGLPVPDDQEETPGGPPPSRPVFTSIPPGFAPPPDAPSPASPASASRPDAIPTIPTGAAVPGTIVQPPPAPSQQRPPRR